MYEKAKRFAGRTFDAVKSNHGVFVVKAAVIGMAVATVPARAVSVLDTSTLLAITTGFGDMKDTLLGLLSVAWPYLIAVPVIMMAPKIVSKLVKMIGRG